MNFRRDFKFAAIAIAMMAFAQVANAQTAGDGKLANMTVGASGVRWDILVPNSGGSVTVSFPDGRSIRKAFKAGSAADVDLSDKQLEGLPDGVYNYELRLAPSAGAGQKRGDDDEPEAQRSLRKRTAGSSLSQSGTFAIVNGALIGPGAIEGERTGSNSSQPQPKTQPASGPRVSANTVERLRNHRFSLAPPFDIVQPDDVITQGSLCVGLDCVNNDTFNFDTIRLKENNTRISFNDTSTGAGFPTNDWTIRANSSANGGGNFLAFVDRGASEDGTEVGTIVFEVDAGAPANALRVASTGKVGIRTATPVLDVHVNTTDTPAMRYEQNNSGGFTAQTWDVAGNEANFFVRDVTAGARLPVRIRPGAPTSSIDIAASGNVGIGTASPTVNGGGMEVSRSGQSGVRVSDTAANGKGVELGADTLGGFIQTVSTGADLRFITGNAATQVMYLNNAGNVGIGTSAPDLKLSVSGDADKSVGGGSWQIFSDERLKNIKGGFNSGLKAVMQLQPIRFKYKPDNALGLQSEIEQVGFGAHALQKVVPEAVTKNANGYLMVNNDPILWTMLNAIKEQQKEIESLKSQVAKLKATSHRRQRK